MFLRSQKTSAELEKNATPSIGEMENQGYLENSAETVYPSYSNAAGSAVNSVDSLSRRVEDDMHFEMRRSSLEEGGQFAAGIVVSSAMNAAAAAVQPTAGSVSNCIGNGGGDNICDVRNNNRGNLSAQGEISGINASPVGQPVHFKPEEISLMLPSYSGSAEEDVNHFVAILENTKQALNIDDFIMKLVVIRNLKANALSWLHSQADFMTKDYAEIIRSLKVFFDRPINTFEIRKRLEKKTWSGLFETFADYCQAKKVLAQKLKMPDQELVDYIVEGILDPVLKNQARMSNFKTVTEIVQAFRMIGNDSRYQAPLRNSVKCYTCNQFGHVAACCWKTRENFGQPERYRRNPGNGIAASKRVNAVAENDLALGDGRHGIVDFQLADHNSRLKALFDTGSPISLIRRGLVEKIQNF